MPATYGKSTAEALFKGLDQHLFSTWAEIRDDGIWVHESQERNLPLEYSWTYSMDLDRLDGPDPKKGLALPFDFTAAELAAFSLGGAGHILTSTFGPIESAPFESAISMIPGTDGYRAAHALREAYRAAQHVMQWVGTFDGVALNEQEARLMRLVDEQEAQEQRLRQNDMPNRERLPLLTAVQERLCGLSRDLDQVRQVKDAQYAVWRKKMVSALLRPEDSLNAESDVLATHVFHVLDDIARIKHLRQQVASAIVKTIPEIRMQREDDAALRQELAAAEKRLAWIETSAPSQNLVTAKRRYEIREMAKARQGEARIPNLVDPYWEFVAETNRDLDSKLAGDAGSHISAPSKEHPKPLGRQRAQEVAILNKLAELGHQPLALPPGEAGKAGIRGEVKSALGTVGMWAGKQVFKLAWDRLLASGEIVSSSDPTST